ncbi:MAG: M23 family metallopeptidase [Chloroflexi bacterium]|nr:MAG: M23 family metallopeptidase [Chloroflexota bacterium]
MPNLKELLERENQAGNQEDGQFNGAPGRQKNQAFDDIARNTEQEDFNDIMDRNLDHDSPLRTDSHGDTVQRNYNADDSSENIDDVKSQEESSLFKGNGQDTSNSSGGFGGKLKGFVKKKGPTAGIVGLLLGGMAGFTLLLSPAALLVAIEKAVTNDGSDSSRTNGVMRRAYIGNVLSSTKDDKPCEGSKVKCKFKSIGDKQLDNWKKLGFNIESTKDTKNGRNKVTKITFPDGKEVNNGKEYHGHIDKNVNANRSSNRVLNLRSFAFMDAKFNSVLKKFNISKGNILKSSNSRDKAERKAAIDKSFNENVGAGEDKQGGITKVRAALDKAKKTPGLQRGVKSIGPTSSAIAIACTAYNTVRVTNALVKAELIYQLIAFAYPFVQAASQIQDQGNIEPEVTENIGDRLTWYDKKRTNDDGTPNEKFGLTATDSQGLQTALSGDYSALTDFAKTYTTGSSLYAIAGSQVIRNIQDTLGKDNIRSVCIGNSYVGLASSATCLAGPWAAALCVGLLALVWTAGPYVIDAIIDKLSDPAMKAIANANLTSDLKGVDAGNALAAGIGLMLSYNSLGSGNRPVKDKDNGGVNQVKQFITATDPEYNRQVELAKYEAKDTPFDMYNQYSFAGRLAVAMNPYNSGARAGFDKAANMLAVLTTPLSMLSTTASALHSQPSMMTANDKTLEGRMNNCGDVDMADTGLGCDWSGRLIGFSSPNFLTMASNQATEDVAEIDSVTDRLIAAKDIDDDGKPVKMDEDIDDMSEYAKYRKFCTEQRTDYVGTSSIPIEEGSEADQDWYDGKACAYGNAEVSESRLDDFAFYFNWCERQFPAAEGLSTTDCWSDSATPSAPTGNAGGSIPANGPWGCPVNINAGGVMTQAQHDIGNGTASGVDYGYGGNPIGPPAGIYAVRDGTVVEAGPASGYGNWVMIQHEENGQPIYSYYGHMQSQHIYVKVGDSVKIGQHIADQGSEGYSSGPHVHVGLKMSSGPTAQDYETRFMAACQ